MYQMYIVEYFWNNCSSGNVHHNSYQTLSKKTKVSLFVKLSGTHLADYLLPSNTWAKYSSVFWMESVKNPSWKVCVFAQGG